MLNYWGRLFSTSPHMGINLRLRKKAVITACKSKFDSHKKFCVLEFRLVLQG